MLCNANLVDQGFLGVFFTGNDSDFNSNWFTSQGDTIVGSMVFNIYFPFFMEIGYWMMRLAYRLKDYLGRD